MPDVILVDQADRPVGRMEKQETHRKGLLHRAFSVFLLDGSKLLIQRRALDKYHCGGLWSNTCCSHPAPGEPVLSAAERRLDEELGIKNARLRELDTFLYRAAFPNGLTEHELDHVLLGEYSGPVQPDPMEIAQVRWIDLEELQRDLQAFPQWYTPWFPPALTLVLRHLS